MKKIVDQCVGFIYFEAESMFKVWQIFSWIMLLMGYSLLIVAYTLFGEPPFWMIVLGLLGVGVTIVNFFIALFIGSIYILKGFKEKDMELIKKRALIIGAYNAAALILYIAAV
ncbi:hypothetical protein [Bacillus toyonensis]|uniref:hypothetical protein n=1 Tax=Bacillus toyonensis TaxID=155322 RepID=UPI002E204F40|nr:hypothetical protein [Bacillus toyonensis]